MTASPPRRSQWIRCAFLVFAGSVLASIMDDLVEPEIAASIMYGIGILAGFTASEWLSSRSTKGG